MRKLSDYVKTAETAKILGLSQTALRRWAEQGKTPMRRDAANGYRLFQRSDLDAFLKQTAKPVHMTRNRRKTN